MKNELKIILKMFGLILYGLENLYSIHISHNVILIFADLFSCLQSPDEESNKSVMSGPLQGQSIF